MSEYQYYEFLAVDRPLGDRDQKALRELSTRAQITATSFTNFYEWGSLKGDPAELMARWFDLHVYVTNWGTRRFMIRLSKRLVDARVFERFLLDVDNATLKASGENLILDIERVEEEPSGDWEAGEGWLAALAPLRADLLAGDLRLLYLVWLSAVEADRFEADTPEPMPGIGPMTEALKAFAAFFMIDPDLVEAAAERALDASTISPDAASSTIAAMTDREKTDTLMRVLDGEPNVTAELRAMVRRRLASQAAGSPAPMRLVGDLRSRAREIRLARERAEAQKAAAKSRRQLDAIASRGDSIWREIETEIERRDTVGYKNAVKLLLDLRMLAENRGGIEEFTSRLDSIRERHRRKGQLIVRLKALG